MPSYGALRGDREHRVWIAGAIRTLLANYWQDDGSERLDAAAGKQWADDLEAFPQPVIEAAINHWRRTETKRPTPAHIIRLCGERMPRPTFNVVEFREPERVPCTPEQAKAILREHGYDREPEIARMVRRMPRSGDE